MSVLRWSLAAVLALNAGLAICADDEAERLREFETMRQELAAMTPARGAEPQEVLTYVEVARERLGEFSAKHKQTAPGFEAAALLANLMMQVHHPEALKYAEAAAEAAPKAGVDVRRIASCWQMVAEGRIQARDLEGAKAALNRIKDLDEEIFKALQEQFEKIEPLVKAQIAAAERLKPGSEAPELMGTDVLGNNFNLRDWKGKVAVVYFWSTGCAPCMQSLPSLVKFYEELHGKGVELVGVSLDVNDGQLRNVLETKHVAWTTLCDYQSWNGAIPRRWDIHQTPTTYVIDRHGMIHGTVQGVDALRATVEKMLSE
jgi:peroxiredoxin